MVFGLKERFNGRKTQEHCLQHVSGALELSTNGWMDELESKGKGISLQESKK